MHVFLRYCVKFPHNASTWLELVVDVKTSHHKHLMDANRGGTSGVLGNERGIPMTI